MLRGSLGPPESKSQTASQLVQLFLHRPPHCSVLYFTMAAPSPQNSPFPWGTWTPSNTWFLGTTSVVNPNRISITSAVFAGLTTGTDRQTDHTIRSVTVGHIYIRSTAMRPMFTVSEYKLLQFNKDLQVLCEILECEV